MTDLAKVADLALVIIDASIGFEMATFEFLSLLRVRKNKNAFEINNFYK
jgi:hypothetical protein